MKTSISTTSPSKNVSIHTFTYDFGYLVDKEESWMVENGRCYKLFGDNAVETPENKEWLERQLEKHQPIEVSNV